MTRIAFGLAYTATQSPLVVPYHHPLPCLVLQVHDDPHSYNKHLIRHQGTMQHHLRQIHQYVQCWKAWTNPRYRVPTTLRDAYMSYTHMRRSYFHMMILTLPKKVSGSFTLCSQSFLYSSKPTIWGLGSSPFKRRLGTSNTGSACSVAVICKEREEEKGSDREKRKSKPAEESGLIYIAGGWWWWLGGVQQTTMTRAHL